MIRLNVLLLALSLLSACGGSTASSNGAGSEVANGETPVVETAGATELSAGVVPSGSLEAALAGSHRSDEDRARDAYRHPRETLTFFGIQPNMTVVELWPGGGWYTDVLGPYLREDGRLIAAVPSREGRRARYANEFIAKVEARPELYGQLTIATLDPPTVDLGEAGSADMVVTFRSTHSWVNDDVAEPVFRAALDVLRPGGVFGVVQHRAREGANVTETSEKGYVPEAYVVELAERVGFVLDERSDINANPADDTDHPEGVWSLPPSLRGGDEGRAEFEQIGESDRMTLRFRKPGGGDSTG
jgi:predicted methyltransferase